MLHFGVDTMQATTDVKSSSIVWFNGGIYIPAAPSGSNGIDCDVVYVGGCMKAST